MAALAYSPDGQYIVTGGDDGKVSLDELILLTFSLQCFGFFLYEVYMKHFMTVVASRM